MRCRSAWVDLQVYTTARDFSRVGRTMRGRRRSVWGWTVRAVECGRTGSGGWAVRSARWFVQPAVFRAPRWRAETQHCTRCSRGTAGERRWRPQVRRSRRSLSPPALGPSRATHTHTHDRMLKLHCASLSSGRLFLAHYITRSIGKMLGPFATAVSYTHLTLPTIYSV